MGRVSLQSRMAVDGVAAGRGRIDGNPYVGVGHRWWFVLLNETTLEERRDALDWLSDKMLDDIAWVVFPTGGFRL